MEQYEKMNGKMSDEIKLAGLEALVPEELENHLIFHSNRLRTFEDARRDIVTYVEEKFGLRIRDFKPSEAGFCERSDFTDFDVVSSLLSGNRWLHSLPERQSFTALPGPWRRKSKPHGCGSRSE